VPTVARRKVRSSLMWTRCPRISVVSPIYFRMRLLAYHFTPASSRLKAKDRDFCFSASVSPLDLSNPNQMFVSWDRINDRYPGVSTFSNTAEVTGSWGEENRALS
jgi:hypothetical protein